MRPNLVPPADINGDKRSLPILDVGCCEPLKAAFHGAAFTLAAVMGAYNAAAWLRRREPHLAVNAAIYLAAVFWEQRHVAHHVVRCVPPQLVPERGSDQLGSDQQTPDERKAA